jgi:hypothetical protein
VILSFCLRACVTSFVSLANGSTTVATYTYDGLNRRIVKGVYVSGALPQPSEITTRPLRARPLAITMFDEAVAALHQAIQGGDGLHFTESANWILPVRHSLGATLMDAHRYAEAEAVYRQDLARYPENCWSLYGLARSLRMQHKMAEATMVSARFEKSWQHADVKLSSSCFCLQAKN